MATQVDPTDTDKVALLQRYAKAAGPATAKLQVLLEGLL
jgi:hypothetical protein